MLQKIVEKDPKVRYAAEEICSKDFEQLCVDQFASRVIQSLIEMYENFRIFATDYFRQHVWKCIESMPAVYLLVAVIRLRKDDLEIDFVRKMIEDDYTQAIGSKHIKRVVVSYLIKVNEKSLPELFLLFKLRKKVNLVKLFNDKFMPYVFMTFVCKEFRPAIEMLTCYIEHNFRQLLKTKHFMFILMKVVTIGTFEDKTHEHNSLALDLLISAVCKFSASDLRNQRFSYLCKTIS